MFSSANSYVTVASEAPAGVSVTKSAGVRSRNPEPARDLKLVGAIGSEFRGTCIFNNIESAAGAVKAVEGSGKQF